MDNTQQTQPVAQPTPPAVPAVEIPVVPTIVVQPASKPVNVPGPAPIPVIAEQKSSAVAPATDPQVPQVATPPAVPAVAVTPQPPAILDEMDLI